MEQEISAVYIFDKGLAFSIQRIIKQKAKDNLGEN